MTTKAKMPAHMKFAPVDEPYVPLGYGVRVHLKSGASLLMKPKHLSYEGAESLLEGIKECLEAYTEETRISCAEATVRIADISAAVIEKL